MGLINNENSLIIDIGNGTISAGICKYQKNQLPLFLFSKIVNFKPEEDPSSKKLYFDLIKNLDELLKELTKEIHKKDFGKIETILVSFSSPWFDSRMKKINLFNDREFIITKNFIDDVVNKESLSIIKESDTKEELIVLEKTIVHGKINGYTVSDIINKSTKNFEGSLYVSLVNNQLLNKVIENIIKNININPKKIYTHTFPLISFSVIRDYFSKESNFLIMDITSEITDISLIKGDIITKTVSMPSGKNFLLRQLSKKLDVSIEIAISNLNLFLNDKLNEENKKIIYEILESVQNEWSIYFENAFQELSKDETFIPNSVFLTCDDDIYPVYSNFLKQERADSTISFRKNIKITKIDIETLKDFYSKESCEPNEFLVLIGLFNKNIIR